MIDKLKTKIFWIMQISLTCIILGIIVLYSIWSYRDSINAAIMMMDRWTGEDGKGMERLQEGRNQLEIEGIYKFSINQDCKIVKEFHVASDTIRREAIKASKRNSENGIVGNYIYKVRRLGNNEISVTMWENQSMVFHIKWKILFSVGIGMISIMVIYIVAKRVSSTIVKPVEETIEKQKQFISDASHELKTPLAVIEANADVLENKVGKNKWITYIQNEIQSMHILVNELLLLAKMEDRPCNAYKKLDVSKEISRIVSSFESITYEHQIELITKIQENIEWNGEKEDIKHILSTLLDNGVKHTPKKKKILVELAKEKNEIIIQVKNEGEPIPKEERSKIFERFYRVDKARNREEKRYGLGLAIAKQTVEKYHGTIEVNCKEGMTNFIVKIPC